MNHAEELIKVDIARRDAMISGDMHILGQILSDELVWTHSSGKTEDKNAVLQAIESKSVSYKSLTIKDYSITQHDNIYIYQGLLDGFASRDGIEKNLKSKFLSVWRWTGSTYEMLAWQSTSYK